MHAIHGKKLDTREADHILEWTAGDVGVRMDGEDGGSGAGTQVKNKIEKKTKNKNEKEQFKRS
jgi:hypothetical protein